MYDHIQHLQASWRSNHQIRCVGRCAAPPMGLQQRVGLAALCSCKPHLVSFLSVWLHACRILPFGSSLSGLCLAGTAAACWQGAAGRYLNQQHMPPRLHPRLSSTTPCTAAG